MSLNDQLDQLKDQEKFSAMMEYEDKSDDELNSIIYKNVRLINAETQKGNNANLAKVARMLGQGEACKSILDSREGKRKKVIEAKQNFTKIYFNKIYSNVLKLSYAVSPNGQLIAAILEDEYAGLSFEELHKWCEELEQIDDKTFKELLNGLQEENIIVEENDKYKIKHICGKLLSDDNPLKSCKKVISNMNISADDKQAMLGLVYIIFYEDYVTGAELSDPICMVGHNLADIALLHKNDNKYTKMFYECSYAKRIELANKMVAFEILTRFNLQGCDIYHFYILGDRIKHSAKGFVKYVSMSESEITNTIMQKVPSLKNINDDLQVGLIALMLKHGGGPFTFSQIYDLTQSYDYGSPFGSFSGYSTMKLNSCLRDLRLKKYIEWFEEDKTVYFSVAKEFELL